MIVQAHQGFDAVELVMQRRYDLLGPSGEVIMAHVWDAIVEPGWDIILKPWPTPEPEANPPPPLDDNVLHLDDILNPNKGSKKPTGKSRKDNSLLGCQVVRGPLLGQRVHRQGPEEQARAVGDDGVED